MHVYVQLLVIYLIDDRTAQVTKIVQTLMAIRANPRHRLCCSAFPLIYARALVGTRNPLGQRSHVVNSRVLLLGGNQGLEETERQGRLAETPHAGCLAIST